MSGTLYGGQQPIVGSHVYLYGTNSSGQAYSMLGVDQDGVTKLKGVSYNNPAGTGVDGERQSLRHHR